MAAVAAPTTMPLLASKWEPLGKIELPLPRRWRRPRGDEGDAADDDDDTGVGAKWQRGVVTMVEPGRLPAPQEPGSGIGRFNGNLVLQQSKQHQHQVQSKQRRPSVEAPCPSPQWVEGVPVCSALRSGATNAALVVGIAIRPTPPTARPVRPGRGVGGAGRGQHRGALGSPVVGLVVLSTGAALANVDLERLQRLGGGGGLHRDEDEDEGSRNGDGDDAGSAEKLKSEGSSGSGTSSRERIPTRSRHAGKQQQQQQQ